MQWCANSALHGYSAHHIRSAWQGDAVAPHLVSRAVASVCAVLPPVREALQPAALQRRQAADDVTSVFPVYRKHVVESILPRIASRMTVGTQCACNIRVNICMMHLPVSDADRMPIYRVERVSSPSLQPHPLHPAVSARSIPFPCKQIAV